MIEIQYVPLRPQRDARVSLPWSVSRLGHQSWSVVTVRQVGAGVGRTSELTPLDLWCLVPSGWQQSL